MKKIVVVLFVILAFCGRNEKGNIILTSNYPLKLILQEITKGRFAVECLVPPSVSPHTFQPKPSDIAKIEKSVLFFYTSDLLDQWISKSIENKISVFNFLPISKKLTFEDGKTYDPHFWTDPTAVIAIIDSLAKIISNVDAVNSSFYLANADTFKTKLAKLDISTDLRLNPIKGKSIFLFHPSFRYFLNRYGLQYGGSVEEIPGAEPTPNHISNIIDRIHKSGTKAIFSEPQLNPNSAKVVAEIANVRLYELDPLGNHLEIDTYEKLLLYNTEILLKAMQ